jgi:hypothetical protein
MLSATASHRWLLVGLLGVGQRRQLRRPGPSLGESPSHDPQIPARADQAKPQVGLTLLQAPAHGRPQLLLFERQRGVGSFVARPTNVGVRLPPLSKRRKEGGVLAANDTLFAGCE